MTNLNQIVDPLCAAWLEAKETERKAIDARRQAEDALFDELRLRADQEGTTNVTTDRFKVKVTSRLTRKVDADKVQELAAEAGVAHLLPTLFRWKPDINMAAWKNTDEALTRPLLGAIETKPGRASFSIEKKDRD